MYFVWRMSMMLRSITAHRGTTPDRLACLGWAGSRNGFSLVELLIVLAVISLLISLALPALSAVRNHSERTHCAIKLRSIVQSLHAYAANRPDRGPVMLNPVESDSNDLWIRTQYVYYGKLYERDYLSEPDTLWCPTQRDWFAVDAPISGAGTLGADGRRTRTNYAQRGIGQDQYRHAQLAIAADIFFGQAANGGLVNHRQGINIAWADGAVRFTAREPTWHLGTKASWIELEQLR